MARRAQSVQVGAGNESVWGVSAARAFLPSLSEPVGVLSGGPATAGRVNSYCRPGPGLLGIALSLAGEAVPLQAWLVRPKEYTAWCPCGKFWAPGRPAGPRFRAIAVEALWLGSLAENSGRVQGATDGSSYRSRRGFGPSTARCAVFLLCRVCQAAIESSRLGRHLGPQSGIASIGG